MNSNPQLQVITGRDNPALVAQASRRIGGEWPEFMLHDPVADNFPYCYENLPEYQFILLKQDENEPIAIGNSIPLAWNESLEDLPDDIATEMRELYLVRKPWAEKSAKFVMP